MLTFTLNHAQYKALQGLSYWVADVNYLRERFGNSEPEIQRANKTIIDCCFPELDRLGVPFWVQNSVIVWSENWRNTKKQYLIEFLKSKNIFVI